MATTNVSLPRYGEPPFDPNGQWSRSWYRFFEALSQVAGGGNVPDLSAIIAAITELRGQIQEQAITPSDITAQLALARLQGLEEWVMGLSKGPDLSQYVLFQTLQDVLSAYAPLSALAAYAPLASPGLTGIPTAPTAALATNTTQLATTAFVQNRLAEPPAIGATTPGSGAFTTISASGAITPSQTAGIVGTTTNNSPNAGSVGEIIANQGLLVAMTSTVVANITSVPLTAGEWNVVGNLEFTPAAGTTFTQAVASFNSVSATNQAPPARAVGNYSAPAGSIQTMNLPPLNFKLAAPATIYLVAVASFTGGTLTASGFIRAQRPR